MEFTIINGTLCQPSLWYNFGEFWYREYGVDPTYPDIYDGKSIAAYAQDIGSALKVGTWLLGYSLGGIIALELAQLYLEKIQGLILVSSNCEGQTLQKEEAVRKQLELLDAEGLEAVLEKILLPVYFSERELSQKARQIAQVKAQIKIMGLELGAKVLQLQLQTLCTRRNQSSSLVSVKMPVLLICGADDPLCGPAVNQKMSHLLPNSQLEVLEHAGHMLPPIYPEQLFTLIKTFVASTPQRDARFI